MKASSRIIGVMSLYVFHTIVAFAIVVFVIIVERAVVGMGEIIKAGC
ncbi:hypothetical protein GCM10007877_37480 [Marinibactrum halimedae]|uniref:Uncharacterized protein n=1 Tax=Marinibactrum halimedae TaxID=1444977 RepID=A0AA37T9Q3_9GAMM|nr:hypothetical protein GCM10007877_37480 [Marinibactrum halimedae]